MRILMRDRRDPAHITITGGEDGDRTRYLLHAMQALSQMSYIP
jgi:hypothetical protein